MWQILKKHWLAIFKRSPDQQEDQGLKWALQTRSWFFYNIFVVFRVWQFFRKSGAWYSEQEDCSSENFILCIGPYDKDIIDPMLQFWKTASNAVLFTSVILCILAYWWRGLANLFLILEALTRLCFVFIPNYLQSNSTPLHTTVVMTAIFIVMFVHAASSLTFMTLVLAIQIFVGHHIVYMRDLTIGQVVMNIALLCAYFGVISLGAAMMEYIKHLQGKLRMSNEAQANMLNGMHEGVLILNENLDKSSDDKVLFCNWPAQKILQTFIGIAGTGEENLLSKLCFQPIQENTFMSFLTKRQIQTKDDPSISLEMLILMQKDEPNQKSCIYKMKTKRTIA